MPTNREFNGTLHYSGDRSLLDIGGGQVPTLALDRPPFGVTNTEDLLAATNFFRGFLQLPDGNATSVEGYLATFGPLQVIQVTRIL
jgi:hypothetical protein